jgi:hypothetical protein
MNDVSTAMEQRLRKTPTDRMKIALEKFRVPKEEIEKMSFEQARERLDSLIKGAKERATERALADGPKQFPTETFRSNSASNLMRHGSIGETKDAADGSSSAATEQANATLQEAAKLVMGYFEIADKGKLTEAHIGLIQELSRQIYSIKYWVGKE